MITDCHIHIQPMEMFKPHALELMKKKRANFDQIVEFCRSPKAFLKFLDAAASTAPCSSTTWLRK